MKKLHSKSLIEQLGSVSNLFQLRISHSEMPSLLGLPESSNVQLVYKLGVRMRDSSGDEFESGLVDRNPNSSPG